MLSAAAGRTYYLCNPGIGPAFCNRSFATTSVMHRHRTWKEECQGKDWRKCVEQRPTMRPEHIWMGGGRVLTETLTAASQGEYIQYILCIYCLYITDICWQVMLCWSVVWPGTETAVLKRVHVRHRHKIQLIKTKRPLDNNVREYIQYILCIYGWYILCIYGWYILCIYGLYIS